MVAGRRSRTGLGLVMSQAEIPTSRLLRSGHTPDHLPRSYPIGGTNDKYVIRGLAPLAPDRVGALPASTPMAGTARVTQHAAPSAATPPPPAPGRSHPTATEPGPPDPANARGPVSPHAHEPYGTRRTSHAATAPQAPHTPSSTTPSSPGPA